MTWQIYEGTGRPHDGITRLPEPPPWRQFDGGPVLPRPHTAVTTQRRAEQHQAEAYQPEPETVELVNAALYLRRPLLVTGLPGVGKSTLAYAIAHELRLGTVLHWPITSRTTLKDGLYHYDPLSRLQAVQQGADDLGTYLRLGPLGTALLPYEHPRVLLVDEVDKSDHDLPNDLLTIFEKGDYEIPELMRVAAEQSDWSVPIAGSTDRVMITNGTVRCRAFPLVVMTSNAEREFPPAFLRRCIRLEVKEPGPEQLDRIVRAHLGDLADSSADLIQRFLERRSVGDLATDQLLNAIYLLHRADSPVDRHALADRIFSYLSPDLTDDRELDHDAL
ncbi:MoxR family ATPase [Actinoplanes bogorensis]|uniref:MoxR family ATPase n=1 Tax=Paractinoplanes bogorensis TaxID=1610840 RepID=A0ABS5YUX9_9ACTN|nr:MoxR family ATPase [Actinoplanes bogorensis]MBU2667141.1 MoxR family ATPase [Actinoplanes bogorensis]